jgi:hypothetical protein
MINEILVFLKNSLNAYLSLGGKPHDPQEDQVVFLVWQTTESLNFKLGAITLLLVGIEQENVLRASDLYHRRLPDGTVQRVDPEIRLNLHILFVPHYQQYEDTLRNLSAIIQYFQNHRLFTQNDSPELDVNIEQLMIELVAPPISEQSQIWSSLRAPYRPSVLYKVKTVVFEADPAGCIPAVDEKDYRISQ